MERLSWKTLRHHSHHLLQTSGLHNSLYQNLHRRLVEQCRHYLGIVRNGASLVWLAIQDPTE